MGISKIQAADNVLAFIPNASHKESGFIRAKFLKTRDSGGVGSFVDFRPDWGTLTFTPWDSGTSEAMESTPINRNKKTYGDQNEYKKIDKKVEKPLATVKSDEVDEDDSKNAAAVIRKVSGTKKPYDKRLKLC